MSPRHGAASRVPPPRRDREHHPSFSAALLDAIYHSLDGDACAADAGLRRANVSPDERPPPPPPCGRRHSTTASSPSGSSSRSPRSQKPPRPCRVRPHPQAPSLLLPPPTPVQPGDGDDEKRRNRRRRKRRARSAPFACLLNALLCNRKPPANSSQADADAKAARAPLPAVRAEPASARSILSSRASRRESAASLPGAGFLTLGRRAVRFSPAVEIVGDEEHGCGARMAIGLRDVSGSGTEVAVAPRESAAEAERRVEELLRALGAAEERERAKESSESSSDLFELDSFPAALDGGVALPPTRAADLAPPRPRVLLDEMVV